jgi:segregation and condensation protein A
VNEYKVALEVYNGPLDLLLYLIRREEVDIYDIPIARVTEQYIKYVELLEQLEPESASEFLVLAATLMEIKSRMLLPTPPPEEGDEDIGDPRLELVKQLLEYKKFKDAAYQLDDAARLRALKYARAPALPEVAADEVELENLDIWDLFDAFNKLLEQTGRREAVHTVGIDDTPIALHAEDIQDSIARAGGSQRFEEIFVGRTRAEMIGLFLALLELIRQRRVRVTQDRPFHSIWLYLIARSPEDDPAVESGMADPGDAHVAEVEHARDAVAHDPPLGSDISETTTNARSETTAHDDFDDAPAGGGHALSESDDCVTEVDVANRF